MKKLTNILLLVSVLATLGCVNKGAKTNHKDGDQWNSLFNGENLDGWVVKIQHHDYGNNYANTFRVKDGKIQVNYDDYTTFDERFGHLFYHQPFSSYHLRFKYRFTDQWMEGAPSYAYRNSGVMFHSQDPKTILKEQDWPISVEYQILAEETEGTPRPTGNVCSPGTEVYYNGEIDPRHCINSTSQTYKWDTWVSGELIVHGDSIVHIINGEVVLKYSKPTIGGGVVSRFDPAVKMDGKLLTEGYIALQSEGHGIEFKEIEIKVFDESETR